MRGLGEQGVFPTRQTTGTQGSEFVTRGVFFPRVGLKQLTYLLVRFRCVGVEGQLRRPESPDRPRVCSPGTRIRTDETVEPEQCGVTPSNRCT